MPHIPCFPTRRSSDLRHIRDMIEQVLFTSPGERVNRPTFGSGLMQMVFQPNSDEMAAAIQFLVQGSLQQWLRSEEHTSELQSPCNLVCRPLLEKKNKQ